MLTQSTIRADAALLTGMGGTVNESQRDVSSGFRTE